MWAERLLILWNILPQTLHANSGKVPSPFGTTDAFDDVGGLGGFVTARPAFVDPEVLELLLSGFVGLTLTRFGSDGFMKLPP